MLACSLKLSPTDSRANIISEPKIERHKAAIVRQDLSKPVRIALEAQLFQANTTFFDYGCGHGRDVQLIAKQGYPSSGWDPHYQPQAPKTAADIVNLGYILNVIEDTAERRRTLLQAWDLTQQVLIVAAQVMIPDTNQDWVAYGDGIVTSRKTFQKYYEQDELKHYIDQVLGVDAIPVAPGIFFVFRDAVQAQAFRASRFRSRATAPRIRLSVRRFEDYQAQLQPLMAFFTQRGRLPTPLELEADSLEPLLKTFGSIKRAFRLVLQATDPQEWEAIADKRRNDLLVFIALSHFHRRPKLSQLPAEVQQDIRSLFGSYQQACTAADLMLMALGRLETIQQCCAQSPIGHSHHQALWVHHSALDQLDPLLRLYEGCASRTLGRPSEATVIQLSTRTPRITYLHYPNFDRDPHPPLKMAMQIDLQNLQVRYQDYDLDPRPPLLHAKDRLVAPDYPQFQKFARLTRQEEQWGLLDDPTEIRDRRQWEQCLADHCATFRGHRLVRRPDADPIKLKFLKAQVRWRQTGSPNHSPPHHSQ
ncbi:DNA phosphorothioation-associated putative methyltransferase [Lyngbya confervoides]|uniref:DNA phosphorothioation-associated putative methyltransferase n=1 Tax=Lyngbya confervoides BDU141951 TaxID=1574623 RepID=A0ABD4SZW9_9CYAN|nr:DNA phosphorothioation-associated putative methyltransferase [Lyngbya confervoides]MCM1982007.1 DNA phosphorothioation-associated putative methyltransferase [Lyngbya confervoides BDU141951]